jgi:16S rRNA (guanine1207-N2)-methyltransferase
LAGSRLELVFGGTPPEGARFDRGGCRDRSGLDLFDAARIAIVRKTFADHQALKARGFEVATAAAGGISTRLSCSCRGRGPATRARIAEAVAHLPPAPRAVDRRAKDRRHRRGDEGNARAGPVDEAQSRAHGKIFRVTLPQPAGCPPIGRRAIMRRRPAW